MKDIQWGIYYWLIIIINSKFFTSSGTFSISPFVLVSLSSFLTGFCLSFLLNEMLRKDHFFLTFSFLGFLPLSLVNVSSTLLLSFKVSSALLLPFSVVGDVAVASVSIVFSLSDLFSFSAVKSFSFSVASFSTFFSLSYKNIAMEGRKEKKLC